METYLGWTPEHDGDSPVEKVKSARTGVCPVDADRESVDAPSSMNDSNAVNPPPPPKDVDDEKQAEEDDAEKAPDASNGDSASGTKFNLHGMFCCHQDWRHSHHASYVNRTNIWNNLRSRGLASPMYVVQSDRCANDYWSGPALVNHLRWIDGLGFNGFPLVNLYFIEIFFLHMIRLFFCCSAHKYA